MINNKILYIKNIFKNIKNGLKIFDVSNILLLYKI